MRTDCIRFLVESASKGDKDSVSYAIEAGVSLNGVSRRHHCTPLAAACSEGNLAIAKLLLDRGALLATQELHQPLSCAASRGHTDIVRLLIERGAVIDDCGEEQDGYTALMMAASNAHDESARLLISSGADIDFENAIGDTPLSKSRDYEWRYRAYNPVVDFLLDAGASNYGAYKKLEHSPQRPDTSTLGKPVEHDEIELVDPLPDILTDKDRIEALIQVVDGSSDLPLGILFRQKDADANVPHPEDDYSALGYAVKQGNADILQEFLFFDADPDEGGSVSTVHEAILQNRLDILQLLLDGGADPNKPSADGTLPLDSALAVGHDGAAKMIQKYIDHPPE